MIDKTEIDNKAEEFKINPANVQKDYVFGWMLQGIYTESLLGEKMILKGGNALRKAYYPDTRFSKDLDFSVQDEVDPELLKQELNKLSKLVGEKAGVVFNTEDTRVEKSSKFGGGQIKDKQVYEARLYFKSSYGEEKIVLKVQLDITSFDKILLPIQLVNLLHPYSDVNECVASIKAHKLEEILASKMNTLLQRRKASDLFDFAYSVFVNKKYDVGRLDVIRTFLKKSTHGTNPNTAKQALLTLPLEEFRSNWDRLMVPSSSMFSFETIVSEFKNAIETLFSILPQSKSAILPKLERRGASSASGFSGGYLSQGVRNTIISSGRSRNMIRLVYDGIARIVEPYALEYRVRKRDNRGMEYLWAWDTSGGRSGHIGIKMFIYDKIESVSPTNTNYSPRPGFVVEF